MDSIGAEVGQKMRSAIKAKLLELNCYVDEELPDYIMVMVANKRSKSQMNEDLTLFLSSKTSTFVDWLHIVLKKLKEVTVTNPEVYKKVSKKKATSDIKVKKEKKPKKLLEQLKTEESGDSKGSLTDNLPIASSRLFEQRRAALINDDLSFDIPPLSQIQNSSQADLEEIEKKIKSVKSRLGLLVESEDEEEQEIKTEEDYVAVKSEQPFADNRIIEIHCDEEKQISSNQEIEKEHTATNENHNETDGFQTTPQKRKHTPITFEKEEPLKKRSVLERLGKKASDTKPNKISLSEFRREEEKFLGYSKDHKEPQRDSNNSNKFRRERSRSPRSRSRSPSDRSRTKRISSRLESRNRHEPKRILSRIGLMSKVHVPQKDPEPDLDELKTREVRSTVQVKPRVIPPDAPQPNKTLLLKAVAEAHRSIAQAPKVKGINLSDSPKKRIEQQPAPAPNVVSRKFPQSEKTKLRNLILLAQGKDEEVEDVYVPKPIRKVTKEASLKYVPSVSRPQEFEEDTNGEEKHQFIVTLDDVKDTFLDEDEEEVKDKEQVETETVREEPVVKRKSAKLRLQGRKSPSPIIFDKVITKVTNKINVPDKLPIVRPSLSIKNKERCKYWPSCRQGDKCEFVHPSSNCEMFPNCKFGDQCLYLHPACKFSTSCTKRDCPYSHMINPKAAKGIVNKAVVAQQLQTCKFFPNCANISCQFYHPKPCKYGKYCKNPAECTFSHQFNINKSNLTWRSKQ